MTRGAGPKGLRILHVAAGNLFGGIEQMLVGIARAGSARPSHAFALAFDARLARELREAGGSVAILGDVRFRRPDSLWRARRRLRALLASGGHDAVVCHAPWPHALAAPVVRRAGLPLLLWIHDAPRPDLWVERMAARTPPDIVICNSRGTAEAASLWLPRVKKEVIHPPVLPAPPIALDERRAIRGRLGAGERTAVIILASRLERWKGHDRLLRAGARLRGDFGIWIAGAPQRPHEEAFMDELRQIAADPALRTRVRFVGERTDVRALMQAADLHCQPNVTPEPFGMAFVEALYAGLPVVTTAIGGALEIVTDRCGVLLADSQEGPLAEALQRLVDDPGWRATLGAEGPRQARRISDPDTQLARLGDVVSAELARVPAA